jgi:hypothetical protein
LDYRGINCTVGRYLLYKSVTKRRGLYKYQSRLTGKLNKRLLRQEEANKKNCKECSKRKGEQEKKDEKSTGNHREGIEKNIHKKY